MRGWYLPIVFCLAIPLIAQDGTASLSGQVRDLRGIGIPHALAELRAEKPPGRYFKTESDDTGLYAFRDLPADGYALRLLATGFYSVTVKPISVGEGEQRAIPPIDLLVGEVSDCGHHGVVDHLTILPSAAQSGSITGTVRLDRGPGAGLGRPIVGADVALLCSVDSYCRKTRTNSNGEFKFLDLPAKQYAISVSGTGFYPLFLPGFMAQSGVESKYHPIAIEACPRGDCNPKSRPKRAIALCE